LAKGKGTILSGLNIFNPDKKKRKIQDRKERAQFPTHLGRLGIGLGEH
jgi:hypothetical protein